eukprot:CAMPEP_0119162406 /NCGR_PEP_ID=MMETSP1315-20130426/2358_1 /TAXON_ID=676789 /ORGANISM="Prasinoderma singularis, Strain RCC927" /LENGTH=540 /DNA_ID=CAMNT_0007155271 /DNA_START=1 /DNA_END=1623 /DNA_ORIENTATION=-
MSAVFKAERKLCRKVYIPLHQSPGFNFVGLVIGPGGQHQKILERASGAKVAVRGHGGTFHSTPRRDGRPDGSGDELHVLVQADGEASLATACHMIEHLLAPPDGKAWRPGRHQESPLLRDFKEYLASNTRSKAAIDKILNIQHRPDSQGLMGHAKENGVPDVGKTGKQMRRQQQALLATQPLHDHSAAPVGLSPHGSAASLGQLSAFGSADSLHSLVQDQNAAVPVGGQGEAWGDAARSRQLVGADPLMLAGEGGAPGAAGTPFGRSAFGGIAGSSPIMGRSPSASSAAEAMEAMAIALSRSHSNGTLSGASDDGHGLAQTHAHAHSAVHSSGMLGGGMDGSVLGASPGAQSGTHIGNGGGAWGVVEAARGPGGGGGAWGSSSPGLSAVHESPFSPTGSHGGGAAFYGGTPGSAPGGAGTNARAAPPGFNNGALPPQPSLATWGSKSIANGGAATASIQLEPSLAQPNGVSSPPSAAPEPIGAAPVWTGARATLMSALERGSQPEQLRAAASLVAYNDQLSAGVEQLRRQIAGLGVAPCF